MKRFIQSLAESLQVYFFKLLLIFLAGWGASIFYVMSLPLGAGTKILWCLLPLLAGEVLIRMIMAMAYGPHYVYSVWSYFLVDDPVYGNAFRKAARAKELDFLLFDRFVFRQGQPRLLDMEENRSRRLNFNVNSLGFRGKEFDPRQKAGKLRIFCSGGSTTACDCNHDEEAWPPRLQEFLRQEGYDTEVINAGVQAWYSYQELLRLEKEIIGCQPDVVLLHQGWNEEFEYSSLSLGRHWRPRTVRNAREENNLYCPANPLLSGTLSLGFYMGVQAILKNLIFIPNMRFTNPRRWEVLLREDYIRAWVDNLLDMARLAEQNNLLMYAIDYPGLVDMADSPEERDHYIMHSRLTPLYADYQAVSKKRISRTLTACEEVIPCLKTEEDFLPFTKEARRRLFHDEIHMTPEGNDLLAQAIGRKLIIDRDFQQKYKDPAARKSNVNLDRDVVAGVLERTCQPSPYLERYITGKVQRLERQHPAKTQHAEVPVDRYTTF